MKPMRFLSLVLVTALSVTLSGASVRAESLKEALASAYANNPQMAQALLSVKSSAEAIVQAKAGGRPSVSASAGLSQSWNLAGGGVNSSTGGSVGLNFNQLLYDNLRTESGIEQARAMYEVALQSLRNAEQNVLMSAATAYLNVYRDTRLIESRAENVTFLQKQVESSNDRLQIGEGTRIDVSQSEARLAQAVAAYKAAVNTLRTSQANYELAIGHKPQNLSLSFGFENKLPSSIDEAIAIADRDHPAIQTAKAQLRAAQSASDAAKAAFGPTLSLIGGISGTQSFNTGSTGVSGSISLSLSIPIYSGGSMGASVRQANLSEIQSEVGLRSTRDQIKTSVISAWSGLQNSIAQIEAAQSALKASELVVEGRIEEQRVGQATTLEVLNAQTELSAVEESLIGAESNRYLAAFSLLASTGRLSAKDLSLPVQITDGKDYARRVEDVWAELRSLPE